MSRYDHPTPWRVFDNFDAVTILDRNGAHVARMGADAGRSVAGRREAERALAQAWCDIANAAPERFGSAEALSQRPSPEGARKVPT